MVQKYQNEIAPIFYYGISTKTNEKDLKIPNFQPPDWKSPYWMTLYLLDAEWWLIGKNSKKILDPTSKVFKYSSIQVSKFIMQVYNLTKRYYYYYYKLTM